jgi:hypothetical protein
VRFASIALLLGLIFMLVSQTTHAAMFAIPAAYGSRFAEVIGQGIEPDRAARSRHANTQPEFQKREAARLGAASALCFAARFSASHSLGRNGSAVIGTASPDGPLQIVGALNGSLTLAPIFEVDSSGAAAATILQVNEESGNPFVVLANTAISPPSQNEGVVARSGSLDVPSGVINAINIAESAYTSLNLESTNLAIYTGSSTSPTKTLVVTSTGSVGVSLNGTEILRVFRRHVASAMA